MEQYFQQPVIPNESSQEDHDKLKSSLAAFDCNICLDFVQDPVVTFCGHLYCWPCIYKWIHSRTTSSKNPVRKPQCPVCKANVSYNTLIPLYGRGQYGKPSDSTGNQHGLVVPQRPNRPGCGVHTLIASATTTNSSPYDPYYSFGDDYPSPGVGSTRTTTFHPMIGMFGEMIYARIFGNAQTTLYAYPNTYSGSITSSPRVRRHVMQVDRSLSRVSFFLFCCVILCLLLF